MTEFVLLLVDALGDAVERSRHDDESGFVVASRGSMSVAVDVFYENGTRANVTRYANGEIVDRHTHLEASANLVRQIVGSLSGEE